MHDAIKKATQTKTLIVLAVIFVISAMFMQFKHSQEDTAALQKKYLESITPMVTAQPTAKVVQEQQSKSLDINGSYMCKYDTINATIYNKQIYMESKTATQSSYMVFKGDCMYGWKNKLRTGDKKCGLGQYVTMAETASSFGMMDASSMMDMFVNSGIASMFFKPSVSANGKTTSDNALKKAMDACVPVKKVDTALFNLPSNVVFREASN